MQISYNCLFSLQLAAPFLQSFLCFAILVSHLLQLCDFSFSLQSAAPLLQSFLCFAILFSHLLQLCDLPFFYKQHLLFNNHFSPSLLPHTFPYFHPYSHFTTHTHYLLPHSLAHFTSLIAHTPSSFFNKHLTFTAYCQIALQHPHHYNTHNTPK